MDEPVAWRVFDKGNWWYIYYEKKPDDCESEPLYTRPAPALTYVDRSDAVNLASCIINDNNTPTPKGIRILADAVMRMDKAIRESSPDSVSVPIDALKWLLGCGDDFERPENAKGNFWWRSEFRKRAGISGETVNGWCMLSAARREG